MSRGRESVRLQVYCRAPAPCRDYCGLTVAEENITLNIWNISRGPHVYPRRIKCHLDEFPSEKRFQEQIGRLFGAPILEYICNLAKREQNLHYLPTKIFLYILKHLAASDIVRLSQSSKIFFDLCNTDAVWKIIFQKRAPRPSKSDMRNVTDMGWKSALKTKLCTFVTQELKGINNRIKPMSAKVTCVKQHNVTVNQTKSGLLNNASKDIKAAERTIVGDKTKLKKVKSVGAVVNKSTRPNFLQKAK